MKAYKYRRSIQSWHWSQNISSDIIYFPDLEIIIYSESSSSYSVKGVTTDSKFIDEAKEYISDINEGKIKKLINEVQSTDEHSIDIVQLKEKFFLKEISSLEHDNATISYPIALYNFEEVDIDTTPLELKRIDKAQLEFKLKKAEFEIIKSQFENEIDNLIKKQL